MYMILIRHLLLNEINIELVLDNYKELSYLIPRNIMIFGITFSSY